MYRCRPFLLALPLASLLAAANAWAEEYKTPANLTADDRAMMMDGKADYKRCLAENLRKYQDRVGDPRALADAAMSVCVETLETFNQELKDRNLHPDYREHYISKVRKEGASGAVQQAMFVISQRQSAEQEQQRQKTPAVEPDTGD